jgi:hypothetical protein
MDENYLGRQAEDLQEKIQNVHAHLDRLENEGSADTPLIEQLRYTKSSLEQRLEQVQSAMVREEEEKKLLTILDLAILKGAKEIDGIITSEEVMRTGFAMFGGCSRCGAALSCANAYPSFGYGWLCLTCIDPSEGYTSLEQFNADEDKRFADDRSDLDGYEPNDDIDA